MKQVRVLWLLAGFLAAPAVPPLLLSVIGQLREPRAPIETVIAFFAVAYGLSAPMIAILGLPALLIAKRFRLVRWWIAGAFGALCGAGYAFLFYFEQRDYTLAWSFAGWGTVVAVCVWLSWHLGGLHERRLAANNSSKPTPLRGAA